MGSGYTDFITGPFYDALCNQFSNFFNKGSILLKYFQNEAELTLLTDFFHELS